MGSEGIWRPVWGGYLEVDSGSILGQSEGHSEVNLRPILGNLMKYPDLPFIWPWVGP